MSDPVAVSIDSTQAEQLRRQLAGISDGVPRVCTAAINRTLTSGRASIVKRIREKANLPAATAKAAIAINKANFQSLTGSLRLSRRPMPMIAFGARQTASGVSVAVTPGGRKILTGSFIARMKSGHVGVFERIGRQGSRARRLPIEERFGPTLLGVFEGAPGVAEEVLAGMGQTLQKNLASQVDRLLAGK